MKILVIRFSSIGDLTQALSIPAHIKQKYPHAEVHFLTRSDFVELLQNNPSIYRIWSIDRKKGIQDLFSIIKKLNCEKFDVIYDAHNNLRSWLVKVCVSTQKTITRPMYRWKRFLLLQFKVNRFEMPFSGQRDLLKPLEQMDIPFSLPEPPLIFFDSATETSVLKKLTSLNLTDFIVFVPSAAYELKRWPLSHWKMLCELNLDKKIVILAGPADQFTKDLNIYENVTNLTGQTSLLESACIIKHAQAIVTNDTGMLHFAEQLGKPTIALMGPAPFGFPSRPSTTILERNISCRPCSKHGQGPCTNANYQECLTSIKPSEVQNHLKRIIQHV